MKKYKTVLYVRVSKEDEKLGESDSIINQKSMLVDFVNSKEDLHLVKIMIDDGYSGGNFERPSFKEMMELVKDRKINCIVVKDFSRFGRDFTEVSRYLEEIFPFMGVRFISLNDNYDSLKNKSGIENLAIPFKNLVNDAYLRDTSIKIRSSLDIKRKKGDFIGSFASYGYLKDPNNKNKLIVDEVASKVVQDIFKYRLQGFNINKISEKLNKENVLCPMEYKKSIGIKTNTNFKKNDKALWTPKAIFRILENPLYIGTTVQKKVTTVNHKVKKLVYVPKEERIIVENTHEPIISKEVFEMVQKLMEIDTRTAPNEEKIYLLSGFVKCGECGANLIRRNYGTKEKPYIYYTCSNKKNQKGCKGSSIKVESLENIVFNAIKKQIEATITLEDILCDIDSESYAKTEKQKLNKKIEEKEQDLKKYQLIKLKIYEDLKTGLLNEEEYADFTKGYSEKIIHIKNVILDFKKKLDNVSNGLTEKQLWIELFKKYNSIKKLDRELIISLIEQIKIYTDKTTEIQFKYENEFKDLLEYKQSLEQVQVTCNG